MPDMPAYSVPPTLHGEETGAPAPMPPGTPAPMPAPKRPRSVAKILALVGALLVVIAALAAAAVYVLFFRYNPEVRRHVPGNANLVVRAELSDIALFGPVRKHLWPLLDKKGASGKTSLRAVLSKETGVDIATDVREVLLASTDGTSWVALFGGKIEPGRVVAGLGRAAKDEGWKGCKVQGDLFLGPNGGAVGQAEDGTVVLGTDATIVRAALPAADGVKRLDLPEDGAVTFAVMHQAWASVSSALAALHASSVTKIDRAHGSITLGSAPVIAIRLEPAAGTKPAALAKDLGSAFDELRMVTLVTPDVAGEKEALRTVTVTANGTGVDVRAPWPLDGLDKGCALLASAIHPGGASK
jgi:hypothetical protein